MWWRKHCVQKLTWIKGEIYTLSEALSNCTYQTVFLQEKILEDQLVGLANVHQGMRRSQTGLPINHSGFGFVMFYPLSYTVVNIKRCLLKVHICSVNVNQRDMCKTIVSWFVLNGTSEMLTISLPYCMLFCLVPINHKITSATVSFCFRLTGIKMEI